MLADHLDAGVLAFGSVMEQVFLRSGNLYTDVVALARSSYNSLRRLLEGAGLFFALPTGGCSEVLTTRIADEGRFRAIAISCPGPSPTAPHVAPVSSASASYGWRVARPSRTDASVLQDCSEVSAEVRDERGVCGRSSGYQHPAMDRYGETDLGSWSGTIRMR